MIASTAARLQKFTHQSSIKDFVKMVSPPSAKKAKLSSEQTGSSSSSSDVHIADLVHEERLKVGKSVEDIKFRMERVKKLTGSEGHLRRESKNVVYYMHRDQRVQDNWALLYAQKLALENNLPLCVVCLITAIHPKNTGCTLRTVDFCLKGLQEVSKECQDLNIGFDLIIEQGAKKPGRVLADFLKENHPEPTVITDFSPLRPHRSIVDELVQEIGGDNCVYRVDAHNIVPIEEASDKQEYAARTIRNKIMSKLGTFLTDFPPVCEHPHGKASVQKFDPEELIKDMKVDGNVKPTNWAKPGTRAGFKVLKGFAETRIKRYHSQRNDPNANALSNLSPWFHIGHLSVQRAIWHVKKNCKGQTESVAGFVEEAVVRSELSDNFCYYQKNYDNLKGGYDWARNTLKAHAGDEREYLYSKEKLEKAKTHDELWNAAQLQLVNDGKIHGFMRMYWAKKILEWTESPEVALETAIYLNDHYSLDGLDANGYVGCMWSIVGIHDQGWTERPVFGKIRYMNYAGCKRKFDINKYSIKHGGKVYKYEKK